MGTERRESFEVVVLRRWLLEGEGRRAAVMRLARVRWCRALRVMEDTEGCVARPPRGFFWAASPTAARLQRGFANRTSMCS